MPKDNVSPYAEASPVPCVPLARSDTGLPGFKNTKEHFEIYVKIRGIVSEELTYRRNRQWDFVKWAITTLLSIIGGLLVLWAKADAKISVGMAFALWLIVLVIALAAITRVLHDAGVIAYRSTLFKEMDQAFQMQLDDQNHKLAARTKLWWEASWFGRRWAKSSLRCWWENNLIRRWWAGWKRGQAEETKTQNGKKPPKIWSSIVYCYLLMIGGLAIAGCMIIYELKKGRSPMTSEFSSQAKVGANTQTEQAKPPLEAQAAEPEVKPSPPPAAETKPALSKEKPSEPMPTPTEPKSDPPKAPEPQRDSATKPPPADT